MPALTGDAYKKCLEDIQKKLQGPAFIQKQIEKEEAEKEEAEKERRNHLLNKAEVDIIESEEESDEREMLEELEDD